MQTHGKMESAKSQQRILKFLFRFIRHGFSRVHHYPQLPVSVCEKPYTHRGAYAK